jgi:phosphohistidine swiveling domain-containing protein
MKIEDFKKHTDWVKIWSGKWRFHSCSQFGYIWNLENLVSEKPVYPIIVYVHRKGVTDCWVPQKDKDDLCKRLMSEIKSNNNRVKEIADSLKSNSDQVLAFIKENKSKKITLEIYNQLWKKVSDYYLPHVSVKYIVDYFTPEELNKNLPILEEARIYAEPVMREQENFMEIIADQIGEKVGFDKELILCTTKDELINYFNGSDLPTKPILEERFLVSAQFFELGEFETFAGDKAVEMEKIVLPKIDTNSIKGQTAYKGKVTGKVTGKVRIVIDPFKYKGEFNVGDILVAGMTRPEFLPLMEKAGAIVTDAGGILSHAAITARELKKPCVIGTQVATKMLKDGDMVEVDADNGIVRIMK